jgi:hypothetical protein
MALTKGMAYDHPAYTSVQTEGAEVPATTASRVGRFAAFTALTMKSITASVITAGTGTGNATVQLEKVAAGGTAISTLAFVVMSTNAAGFTTNVLCTGAGITCAAGDVISFLKGADATGVFAVAVEFTITPGGSVTP